MAFELPALPYAHDALEPHIDARTMEIHHGKHHAAYVNNANTALANSPLKDASVEEVLKNLDKLDAGIRQAVINNAGGHANHALFWQILGPNKGGEPSGPLAEAIQKAFGGFAEFKTQFEENGAKRFGSGWSWLVVKGDGSLALYSTANQDSPIMQGDTPILGLDVWEHAYYLHYQNRRPDYMKAFWNVVNWDKVAELYAAAK